MSRPESVTLDERALQARGWAAPDACPCGCGEERGFCLAHDYDCPAGERGDGTCTCYNGELAHVG